MIAILSVVFALATLSTAYEAPLIGATHNSIPGQYIVVYKKAVKQNVFAEDLLSAAKNYKVHHQFKHVIRGFAAQLDEAQLADVRSNPSIDYVELDGVVRISQKECEGPVPVESWGLTRISQVHMDLDNSYVYPSTAGKGVTVYVVDTGIYIENDDFEGRATFGWKADPLWSSTDKNGHGTHVSSTSVGRKYGVAREANVVGVKVLGDNGSGTNAGVIAGIDWVVSEFIASRKPSVINMSLGGGKSVALNAAVDNAFQEGVVVVVAAGNEDSDACYTSPASATDAISVGATDIGTQNTDIRSYFSNYGKCVSVFAPGSDITAAWIGKPTATNTISGTSMASPHVAGIAALFWSEDPSASAAEIKDKIIGDATEGIIKLLCTSSDKGCDLSPNKFVYTGCPPHSVDLV